MIQPQSHREDAAPPHGVRVSRIRNPDHPHKPENLHLEIAQIIHVPVAILFLCFEFVYGHLESQGKIKTYWRSLMKLKDQVAETSNRHAQGTIADTIDKTMAKNRDTAVYKKLLLQFMGYSDPLYSMPQWLMKRMMEVRYTKIRYRRNVTMQVMTFVTWLLDINVALRNRRCILPLLQRTIKYFLTVGPPRVIAISKSKVVQYFNKWKILPSTLLTLRNLFHPLHCQVFKHSHRING